MFCGDLANKGATKGYTLDSSPRCFENTVCLHRFMHRISASEPDSDDSADVEWWIHSQSKHRRGFHRGDRWSRICQTLQFLSPSQKNVVCVCLFWLVLRPLLQAFWPWWYRKHLGSWHRTDGLQTKTAIMKPSHSLDTPTNRSSMRRAWSQRWPLRHRETKEKIQVPWKCNNGAGDTIAWWIRRRPLERTEHLIKHRKQLMMMMMMMSLH